MVQKIPPPTFFTGAPGQEPDWQGFNRWLLEVTSVLSNEGGIDPNEVTGLPTVIAQVGQNTADILTLDAGQDNNSFDIAALQAQVTNIDNVEIPTINAQLTSLGARGTLRFGTGAPAAGLGNVNDWYGDTAGAVGSRIWIKKAVGVWTAFPF